MAFDPTGDFAAVTDGLVSVTYRARNSTGQYPTPVSVQALKRAGAKQEEGNPIAGSKRTTVFDVVAATLRTASVTPKSRDHVIEQDGTTWVVTKIDSQTFDSRYRLECYEAP